MIPFNLICNMTLFLEKLDYDFLTPRVGGLWPQYLLAAFRDYTPGMKYIGGI